MMDVATIILMRRLALCRFMNMSAWIVIENPHS